jgi:PAS domain S-box-containing protein
MLPGRPICDASAVIDETVTQALLEGQDAVLAGLAAGAPTETLLRTITEMVERCLPGVRCTVRVAESGGTAWDDATRSMPVLLDDQVVASIETLGGLEGVAEERALLERCARLVAVVLHREAEHRRIAAIDSRYRMLIQEMPVIAYEGIGDGPMRTYVSPHIETILGFSSTELATGETAAAWLDLVHPDDRGRVVADWERTRDAGATWDNEYRMVRPDGNVTWVRNVDMVVHDEHGRPIGRQGVIFDVTSHVDTVNALRRAESRWRALVEHLPAVTYIDGLGYEPSYASPQIEELTGMTPEQWLEDWVSALHPDDRDRIVTTYLRHAGEGRLLEAEFRVVRPDGKVTWVSDRAAPVPSSDGARMLFQGVMLDVTAQKQAEMAERESERRFRDLLETVQLGAVITDIHGTITFCNDHLIALSGYSREEVVGRRWLDVFAPGEGSRPYFEDLERGHVTPHDVATMRTRSGEVRTISWSSTPLRDAAGLVVSAASIGEDVTERLRAEQALRESEERRRHVMAEMLRTAEEERTRIATELHDDTVQVMAATLISLDRLVKAIERGDGDNATAAITTARSTLAAAVERTRRLMFELRPPLLESQGLDPALRDLAETAASEAGFEVSAAISVGRYAEAVETLTYRTAQEAISNARKHARAGSLRLTLAEQDGHLRGEVADDGCGFDVRQVIERRSKRLHMGLDTMIERVRMAGGEIAVESSSSTGTTVTFRIPTA